MNLNVSFELRRASTAVLHWSISIFSCFIILYTHGFFMCVIKLYIFTVVIIRCMNSLEVQALYSGWAVLIIGNRFPFSFDTVRRNNISVGEGARIQTEWLKYRGSVSCKCKVTSFRQYTQKSPWSRPASCSVVTTGSFPVVKVAEACS